MSNAEHSGIMTFVFVAWEKSHIRSVWSDNRRIEPVTLYVSQIMLRQNFTKKTKQTQASVKRFSEFWQIHNAML